jgi:hypothetical protein
MPIKDQYIPKKNRVLASEVLSKALDEYRSEKTSDNYIPNILEFCYSPKYLNFDEQGIKLYPVQEIILKVFYRGSKGNENIKLTDQELQLIKDLELNDDDHGDILHKYLSNETFRELVLVWGRRCVGEKTKITDSFSGKIETIGDIWDSGRKTINTYSLDEDTYNFTKTEKSEIIYNGIKNT